MNLRIEPKLNPRRGHTQPIGGFTLVEVMIVVAILAVMGVAGIPALKEWWHNGATQNAAHSLMFHMKEARISAMSESRKIWINFDAYGYTYDATPTTPAGQTCAPCKNEYVPFEQYTSSLAMVKKNTPIVPLTLPANISFSAQGTAKNSSVDILSGSSKSRVIVNIVGRARMCSQQEITAGTC